MLKTYKSYTRNLCIFETINGRVRCIRFSDVCTNKGYGIYTTDKPAEIEALEKRKDFGTAFVLMDEQKTDVPAAAAGVSAVPEKKFDKTFPKVKKIQEAIKILSEQYNIPEDQVLSKTDVMRQASALNISFPNLK